MPRIIATTLATVACAAFRCAQSVTPTYEQARRSLLEASLAVTVIGHALTCLMIAFAYANVVRWAPWDVSLILAVLGARSYFGGCPLTSLETFTSHYLCSQPMALRSRIEIGHPTPFVEWVRKS